METKNKKQKTNKQKLVNIVDVLRYHQGKTESMKSFSSLYFVVTGGQRSVIFFPSGLCMFEF